MGLELARLHAPGLFILAPLAAAALAAMAPPGRWAWVVAAVCGVVMAGLAFDFARSASEGLPEGYRLGDVSGPFGAALRVDAVSAAAVALVAAFAGPALATAGWLARGAFDRAKEPIAVALLLAMIAGHFAMALSGDLITLWLALQLSAVSAAALTALAGSRDPRALPAAGRALVAAGISATLVSLGALIAFRAAGSVEVRAIAGALASAPTQAAAAALGLGMVVAALSGAAILAPFNHWAVLAVGRAPHPAAALIVGAGAAAGFFAIVRIWSAAAPLGGDWPGAPAAAMGLAGLGLVSATIGSAQAAAASDLRRLCAYVAAAQWGCAGLVLAAGGPGAVAAGVFQTAAASLGLIGLLGMIALVERGGRGAAETGLDGFGRVAPVSAIGVTIVLLCVVGAPMTAGFTAKWLMLAALMERQWWWAAVVVAGATLSAAILAARLCERIWLRAPERLGGIAGERRLGWVWLILGAGGALLFGVQPDPLVRLAQAAAAALLGMPPP